MFHRSSFGRTIASVAGAWLLSLQLPALGALVYAVPGSIYFQNFDSLPNSPENADIGSAGATGWTDDNVAPSANQFSIPGWYLHHPEPHIAGGVSAHSRFRAGAGTSGIGAFMSFGVSGSTERALGDVGSDTIAGQGMDIYIALRITNSTGGVLDRFTISFAGEQWRDGGSSFAQSMTFSWALNVFSVDAPAAVFTAAPGLSFTSPIFTNFPGTAIDGNTVGRVDIPALTITGVNWLPGDDLWLRWTDINHGLPDHGLAIDDFSFSAIPEPSAMSLLGLGALGMVRRRRVCPAMSDWRLSEIRAG